MSKKYSVIIVILMVSLCAFGGTNVTLTLVKNKKPIAVIAIPDNASKVIVASAEALNKYIKLITGITLPVRRESELEKADRSVLSLGPTDLAASVGLNSTKMQVGEFICQHDGNVIFIFGRDDNRFNPNYGSGENGTWNGTCRFVEQYLNVRWLWPGKYGLAFSKRDTLSVSMKSPFTEKPVIMSRRCRTPIYQSYWATDWKEVGIDNDEYKHLSQSLYDWQKFHLMGGSVEVSPGGHGFTKWWDNYNKKHPDWFAEQTDGTRNQNFDK